MKDIVGQIECSFIDINVASIDDFSRAFGGKYSNGIWWKQIKKGFWWPVDFTTAVELKKSPPRFKYWGYQHTCYEKESNSTIRYMLINDLDDYGIQYLKSSVRSTVRQSLKSIEFKKINNFNEIECQIAADCWNDLVGRTNWRQKMNYKTFAVYWEKLLSIPAQTIIGAYSSGHLIGWLVGVVFDNGNCYVPRYAALEKYFHLRVNNGLIYSFLISAKKSGAKNANFGLFTPENPNLNRFKQSMGFNVTPSPSYTYINPVIKLLISKFFRKKIDRLTGWYSEIKNERIEAKESD